ncbi:hypothetical protein CFC21_049883 [Triticum aestivum]|uniref:F-box associated beta-propeller type 3 domain-containing protein n=2 Tax=Triticum aestivum TaxID=4565 RepID=A0A9R1K3X1_WHEAT|nr:hypothetical protein CFC21_049883 [Triticum aestivum]
MRSWYGRSSSASTPNPSSAAAPSAATGAAPPPTADSSWPTMPASVPSPSSPATVTVTSSPSTIRDSLHWHPVCYTPVDGESAFFQLESKLVIVFDTIAESFRQIRAPLAPPTNYSCIFEMDDMLGIYSCDKAKKIVDIWVLHNYESEVWDLKYQVDLTIAEIWGKFEGLNGDTYWHVTVVSGDGDVLLLVRFGQSQNWLFYVDIDGKLVASFQDLYVGEGWFKQTLVRHDFFTTLGGHAVDASPFV